MEPEALDVSSSSRTRINMSRNVRAEDALKSSLSDSEMESLRAVRRSVYRGGLEGGIGGFLLGSVGVRAVSYLPAELRRGLPKIEPKHRFAAPLFTFAFGMMLGSMVAARNNVHTIHFILHNWQAGSHPQNATLYQEKLNRGPIDPLNPITLADEGHHIRKDAFEDFGSHDDEDPLVKYENDLIRQQLEREKGEWHSSIDSELQHQGARDLRHRWTS